MQRLPDKAFARIDATIAELGNEPRPRGSQKLAGSTPQWRLRLSEYRVIYTIFDIDRVVSISSVERRTTTTYRKR